LVKNFYLSLPKLTRRYLLLIKINSVCDGFHCACLRVVKGVAVNVQRRGGYAVSQRGSHRVLNEALNNGAKRAF
jgi:hypothetical protein